MKKADLLVSIVMICTGIGAFLKASDFPGESRLMPYIYSALLILVALLIGLRALLAKGGTDEEDPAWKDEPIPRVLLVMGHVLGYVASIQMLGFYASTTLFILVFMGVFHAASLWTSVAVSLGTSAAVYFFFEVLLHIPVPKGILF